MSHHQHDTSGRCLRLLQDLMAYLDGDLTPGRRATVERHLAACDCCDTMAYNVRAVVALCRSEHRAQMPRALRARARARMRALLARQATTARPAPLAVTRRRTTAGSTSRRPAASSSEAANTAATRLPTPASRHSRGSGPGRHRR